MLIQFLKQEKNNMIDIKKEIEKFNKEREELALRVSAIDEERSRLITRIVELQGILNFLKSEEEKEDKKLS